MPPTDAIGHACNAYCRPAEGVHCGIGIYMPDQFNDVSEVWDMYFGYPVVEAKDAPELPVADRQYVGALIWFRVPTKGATDAAD